MTVGYKGRSVVSGERVQVYKNLHTDSLSVRSVKTGKVLAHCESVELRDVKFHVSTSGRERVVRNQVREAHAWLLATFVSMNEVRREHLTKLAAVYYQPNKTETFIMEQSGLPITYSGQAIVYGNRSYLMADKTGYEVCTREFFLF